MIKHIFEGLEQELPIIITEHPEMLHLCGYVGVPKGHPWFGIEYNQCLEGCPGEPNQFTPSITSWFCDHEKPETVTEVHGGLTYSSMGDGEYLPEGYWWFGFDCAHAGDYVPGLAGLRISLLVGVFRDKDYVEHECRNLAKQLYMVAEIKHSGKNI